MIKIGTALFEAAEQLEREKGISKDVLVSSLCDALVAGYKKHIKDKDAENVFKQIAVSLGFNADDYESTEEVYRVKDKIFNKTEYEPSFLRIIAGSGYSTFNISSGRRFLTLALKSNCFIMRSNSSSLISSVVKEYSLTTDLKSIFIPLIFAMTSNAINPVCIFMIPLKLYIEEPTKVISSFSLLASLQ